MCQQSTSSDVVLRVNASKKQHDCQFPAADEIENSKQ